MGEIDNQRFEALKYGVQAAILSPLPPTRSRTYTARPRSSVTRQPLSRRVESQNNTCLNRLNVQNVR